MCVWPYDFLCLTISVRNSFRRARRGCRFFRLDFAFFGPDSRCWIGLFPLYFRHLTERMLFAGYAKQQHAEQNRNDALAEEKTHTALAQLSVSRAGCKNESARVVGRLSQTPSVLSHKRRYNEIERRGHGVTIRRGGPHRQTERLERSLRSHSAFCRHAVVFCADFLHAKRRTVLGLV